MKKPKRKKPRFRVGQLVNLPVRIVKVDRRWKPETYMVQAHVAEWILEDMVEANELSPLPRRKLGLEDGGEEMIDEVKQNAPEFSGRVKAVTQMDAILRDVQANEKRVKKARAKVLAACKVALCKGCAKGWGVRFAKEWAEPCWIHEPTDGYHLCDAGALQELQPAAKALEELLQKERQKGLELANLIYRSDGNFLLTDRGTHEGRMESYDVWNRIFAEAINIRVREKEKARASEEDG